jgi:hypothetical protein
MPAVTSVTNFSDGNVLTATALNAVNCGIHVYSNAAARDAAYGGSGERTLVEGEYAYLLDTDQTLVYSGSSWITVGVKPGLVRVGGGTLSGTSTLISSLFSATYSAYLVLGSGVSTTTSTIAMQMGTTATGYYQGAGGATYAGSSDYLNRDNSSNWYILGGSSSATRYGGLNFLLTNPNEAQETAIYLNSQTSLTTGGAYAGGGYLANQTQYTSVTFLSAGTMAGTINVYGYALS